MEPVPDRHIVRINEAWEETAKPASISVKEVPMLIISASNVHPTGGASRSLVLGHRFQCLVTASHPDAAVLDLREYPLQSCVMCQSCATDGRCVKQDRFNDLFDRLVTEDTLVLVVPHYAAIPSQLAALFEKLQEIGYLASCTGRDAGLRIKRVAVVAHGGATEGFAQAYRENLLTPLGNMVRAMGWTYVNDAIDKPLLFGVKRYLDSREPKGVCHAKEDDEAGAADVLDTLASWFSANR